MPSCTARRYRRTLFTSCSEPVPSYLLTDIKKTAAETPMVEISTAKLGVKKHPRNYLSRG